MSQPKARLDTLLAYAATDGRKLVEKRIKSLLKQARLQCGHAGETVGIVDQLRSRLATARLAVKADNGFAAAQLMMEAEQLASTFNTIRAKPLVTAALGSAGGRPKGIRTEGASDAGGRIDVLDADLIHLVDAEVTSNGRVAQQAQSLIKLEGDTIVLNDSMVTSLTGGVPIAGSGVAELVGAVTVISADSVVAGSSSVEISGLQTNLGSDLQLPANVFLDASRLLRDSCAATGAGPRSSFTRGGRGGLAPSPDRPLPSAGAEAPGSKRVGDVGSLVLDACAGTLVQETNS